MIERYRDLRIARIWSNKHKLELWQKTELAVIMAMVGLSMIAEEIYFQIEQALKKHPINLKWWKEKEKELKHDLAAFLAERERHIPPHLRIYFHRTITSYDTEEPAFATMLKESIAVVKEHCAELEETITGMAVKYRYAIMLGVTHGQEGELITFGKRCLEWLQIIRINLDNLRKAEENLRYSKLSGAMGNYGSISPDLEEKALEILGFKPFYGATQIMPREFYAPIGQALCQLALSLAKIGLDIRLGARSGNPIYQEPFGKKQKGSSAMPHKKNTIKSEQGEGMSRVAVGELVTIMLNIITCEERAIEQSSAERIVWPDLFHDVIQSLKTMNNTLKGLAVYPDNMLLRVREAHGSYASSEAKEFLKQFGLAFGISTDDAYRIIQLAAFNAFEPGKLRKELRDIIPASLSEADNLLVKVGNIADLGPISIRDIIAGGRLRFSDQLDISEEKVGEWNAILIKMFDDEQTKKEWDQIFLPSYLLRNEETLYQKILNI